ncbi:MAG: glycerate kinase type-2 family protein [Fimbriimonas sp.]
METMPVFATPHGAASEVALQIYERVLDAVRADRLIEAAVQREGDLLFVQGRPYDLSAYRRILVAGAGKASVSMAQALKGILGDRLADGQIVTKAGHGEPVEGVEVVEAAHPVPDQTSLDAGRRLLEFAAGAKTDDLVIFLLSGGASALAEAPVEGITLEDLQSTNRALLASGADITLMNAVRSRVSRIKAGGLARAFAPATVVALVLSDVVGNALATIGSGPLVAPTPREPSYELLDVLPPAVRAEVLAGDLFPRETPKVDHYVVGSVSVAVHAAADAARHFGVVPLPYGDPMQGEAREMARQIVTLATRHVKARPEEDFCLIFGGETTVILTGDGRGGRCQEMALAAAPRIARLPNTAFLAAGTDGTDGPTDAAGGLVDPGSLLRAKDANVDHRRALVANDSYRFLEAAEGLIKTGPTGSNVNDVCLVVHLAP